MIPDMKDDDLWMKPPVNYTPWFKCLIKRREEVFQIRLKLIKEIHQRRA